MPYKCSVGGCYENYDSRRSSASTSSTINSTQHVSFHAIPYDPKLRHKWFINMRRDDLKFEDLSTSMRVCSRHFLPEDFEVTPKLRKLKVTAWPRLHPNLPHLNEQLQSARNTSSLASCRLLNENLRIEEVSAKFLLADKFLNFDGS